MPRGVSLSSAGDKYSYMSQLDDIQTTLKPLKNREKLKYIFISIAGLAESNHLNT